MRRSNVLFQVHLVHYHHTDHTHVQERSYYLQQGLQVQDLQQHFYTKDNKKFDKISTKKDPTILY